MKLKKRHIGTAVTALLVAVPAFADPDTDPALAETAGRSALSWYEAFSLERETPLFGATEAGLASDDAGWDYDRRWGLTLGLKPEDQRAGDLTDFSAGAFYRLTPRMRVGGELRFSSPDEGLVLEPIEEKAPEIKLKSAFRF